MHGSSVSVMVANVQTDWAQLSFCACNSNDVEMLLNDLPYFFVTCLCHAVVTVATPSLSHGGSFVQFVG